MEKVGRANQLGRTFPPLTYTADDAAGLTLLEPAPRTIRGARDLLSVALNTATPSSRDSGGGALLGDFFGNEDVLYLMEDMATGEIRLSILWEWLHKGAKLTDADAETGAKTGDVFSRELFDRLLREEYAKLQNASNRDVHDNSKKTTLPVAREIAETCVTDPMKLPWYRSAEHHAGRAGPGGGEAAHRAAARRVQGGRPADYRKPRFRRRRVIDDGRSADRTPVRRIRRSAAGARRLRAPWNLLMRRPSNGCATMRSALAPRKRCPTRHWPRFEAALALNSKGKAVGYATWFHVFDVPRQADDVLEDLFVRDDSRESGAGSALFEHVRTLGAQRDCGRMEWQVLDWNTLAREFYHRRQATWMKDWLVYRFILGAKGAIALRGRCESASRLSMVGAKVRWCNLHLLDLLHRRQKFV